MKPIMFVEVLTRQRIVEELEAIEQEVQKGTTAAETRIRELRIAVAHRPIDLGA